MKKFWERGGTVYHVANPAVQGTAEEDGHGMIGVQFSVEVGFSGNQTHGLAKHWVVDAKLLYASAIEAYKASWEWRRANGEEV